jgi:hypothetical protein
MAEREPALVTPFWVRIATETSLSPGWLLIAFPAVLYPTYLLLEVLFGRGLAAATDFGKDFRAQILPAGTVTLGYIVMMYTYVARGTLRDLESLRSVLREGEAAYAELQQKLTRFERRRLWIGGLVGIAFWCLLWEIRGLPFAALIPAGDFEVGYASGFLLFSAFWITAGRGTVYLVDAARLYSRIGERQVTVDLLDPSPVSPLMYHGLRIVLLLTIITAVGAIIMTVRGPTLPRSFMVAWFLASCWNVPLAAAAFVLPVRGLRRQIRARKTEELAKVREDIRRNRELAAEPGTESAEASTRLPGLLAFEKRIESVRDWPFDAPTLTRFFLYVAIPLGSWIGGALVERLLGAALD